MSDSLNELHDQFDQIRPLKFMNRWLANVAAADLRHNRAPMENDVFVCCFSAVRLGSARAKKVA